MENLPSVYLSPGGKQVTNARTLYSFLGLSEGQFGRWAQSHIIENKYATQGIDYQQLDTNVELPFGGCRTIKDYVLTLPFAKKLAMASDSAKGEAVRDYFLACEQRAGVAQSPSYQIENPIERAMRWIEEEKQRQTMAAELDRAKPKVEAYERTMDAEGLFEISAVAKNIGNKCGPIKLFRILRDKEVLFYRNGENRPTQRYIDAGWFEVKHKTFVKGDGLRPYMQIFVTPLGIQKLTKIWDLHVAQQKSPELSTGNGSEP